MHTFMSFDSRHTESHDAVCLYCRHHIEPTPGVPLKVRICPHCGAPVSNWLFG